MNLSLQTRIVLFFSALFIGVQLLTLFAIYWVSRNDMIERIGQNLIYAENIFNRLLTQHGERIAGETAILAADFGFRSAVSDGDAETVGSALENLTYRSRGQRGFYMDPQGKIIADTAGRLQGQTFMFPEAIANAEKNGKAVAFGMLEGELREIAVVPVLAPLPIGWVSVAITVDRRLVDSLKHLASLPPDISLVAQSGGGLQILASSLSNPEPAFFTDGIFRRPLTEFRQPRLIAADGGDVIALARPLAAARAEQTIIAVLQIDLAQAWRPYLMLMYAVAGLLIFGLLAVLLGGYLLARNITQPLRALAAATRRILAGEFSQPLPVTGNDELGRLAETFNLASRLAMEMSDLKAQDQQRRELVASVSHDLRTPLTSLHGYLETMQSQAVSAPEEERQRFLAVAVRQSEKVGRLAQELFELAMLECQGASLEIETFNILELIQDVRQKFAVAAQNRGVDVLAELDAPMPLVNADIAMMERVLTNLLDNALRHTPAGGTIDIRLHRRSGRVVITVRDTGAGIAPEYLPKLFDKDSPLARRARAHGGGLGLLIVARMVALHGGTVHAESTLGQGSAFSFDLPAAGKNAPGP